MQSLRSLELSVSCLIARTHFCGASSSSCAWPTKGMYSPYDTFPTVTDEPLLETNIPIVPSIPLSKIRKETYKALLKSQSNAEFGEVFATKNKTASKNFRPSCLVTVHDYGPDRYEINGQIVSQGGGGRERQFSKDHQFSDPDGLLAGLPLLGSDKPEWATVRWIDVEGFSPQIVQFLLRVADCERQYTFNNIVDTKQRAMGLLLDGMDEDATKFLLVTKVANLKGEAKQLQQSEGARLYDVQDFVELEQISYLLKNDPPAPGCTSSSGTLISFQEGKDGDVFGELRERLGANTGKERHRGAPYLLMQLVRASCESASDIEHYIEDALEQLAQMMNDRPGRLDLSNKARKIDSLCEELRRVMTPFAQTLEWMTGDKFPKDLLGSSPVAWVDLHMQQHRLNDNIQGSQTLARSLVEGYRDIQAKKSERTSLAMSMILAVFSPLSFISGIYGYPASPSSPLSLTSASLVSTRF
eukprot:CAMPEP_0172188066 /NCGR_PEP_ID=MMETSP1050-20130122/21699_1 /TAXON_ID=233186 /ORGANISM="Cryptomonas curvata, Strain CCAP979/52" /LENGTH=470 /DNA_ID=CAMNT_0012862483 /DNA_START=123 /DNA_END=1535 /DNA_ORIENTATION=-